MADSIIQPSFATGELSPTLYGRVDLAKFRVGAARLYNAWVDYRGGVTSRAGTRFVAMAGGQGQRVRLIKFEFSTKQTYVLELGNFYMRVVKDGGMVLGGDGQPYVIGTPWAVGDLPLLKFAQSNDVMTFTHPNYPIYDLARLAENNWQFSEVRFDPIVGPPGGLTSFVSPPATGQQPTIFHYVVTAVNADGVESLPSLITSTAGDSFNSRTQTITVAWSPQDAAYFNVYKGTPVAFSDLQKTFPSAALYGYIGRTYGTRFIDNNIIPDFTRTPPTHRDPFAVRGIESVTVLAGGTGYENSDRLVTANDATGYGFRGEAILVGGSISGVRVLSQGRNYTDASFNVGGGAGAQLTENIGPSGGTSPGVVTYYQQRKIYAASARFPSTYWASQTGAFNNMDVALPPRDSDALTFTLAALEQNPIKYMIPVQNGLLMLTSNVVWLVTGAGQNTALTPNSVQQTPQVRSGCADVQPLVLGNNILFVQDKGYVVQDLNFNFLNNVFNAQDRTYLASHLFRQRQIVDWCWAQQPNYLVWTVMSDGRMLSLTYLPDQEVYGWAQHDMRGSVLSVAAIAEGDEDYVYLAVQRPFGTTIERMASRVWASMADAWPLDCALRYVGPAVSRVTGVAQADGETVSVVADGVYLSGLVVTDGGVNLPAPASNVLVGYPVVSEFKSLYLDAGEPTIQGKRKRVAALTLRLNQSRGLRAGPDFDQLVTVKDPFPAPALISQDERVVLAAGWDGYGQVALRGEGYPWSLLAIIPEVSVGDSRG